MGFIFAIPAAVLAFFARLGWVRGIALLVGAAFSFVLMVSLIGKFFRNDMSVRK